MTSSKPDRALYERLFAEFPSDSYDRLTVTRNQPGAGEKIGTLLKTEGGALLKNVLTPLMLEQLQAQSDYHFDELSDATRHIAPYWEFESDPDYPEFWAFFATRESPALRGILDFFDGDDVISSLYHSAVFDVSRMTHANAIPFQQPERTGTVGLDEIVATLVFDIHNDNQTAPAYEFVPLPEPELYDLECPDVPAPTSSAMKLSQLEECLADRPVWRPKLENGDMVLLTGRSLRRTLPGPGGNQRSIYLRFWPKTPGIMQAVASPDIAAWFSMAEDSFFGPQCQMGIFHDDGRPKWQLGTLPLDKEKDWYENTSPIEESDEPVAVESSEPADQDGALKKWTRFLRP